MTCIRIATINIRGGKAPTRQRMLMEFIKVHKIDILQLQEVTHMIKQDLFGYETQCNIGTSRSTAIVTREGISLGNIIRLPSGRAIGARFRDAWIMNIYAPSGTAMRHEREHFYTTELAYLLKTGTQFIVMGENFICVLKRDDITGNFNYSRALDSLVGGMDLQDAWQGGANRLGYTYYSLGGVARLDRIYISSVLLRRKQGMET
jgi:exonuclease III